MSVAFGLQYIANVLQMHDWVTRSLLADIERGRSYSEQRAPRPQHHGRTTASHKKKRKRR